MSEMLEAIRSYRRLLADPPHTKAERLNALTRSLDALAMAYHHTPDTVEDDAHMAAPATSYDETRNLVAPRFPELGLYATIVNGPATDLQGTVGDAIDDLVDIVVDLDAVVWRLENTSFDDAVWHFRFGYLTHWGQHLVELRGHLHYLLRQELI